MKAAMPYHAHLEYSSAANGFFNYSEEKIVEDLVVPFVNGQVILLKARDGSADTMKLFNMKNAMFLKLYRTSGYQAATEEKSIIQQLRDPSFQQFDCTAEFLKKIQRDSAPKPTTSLLQKAFQPPQPKVFVIMKFGDEVMNSAYTAVYKPVVKKFGLACIRIDEIPNSGKISDQILEAIAESKYIIADLSGARPNCYYEAGFAHALGKEIILSIRDDENAHFDLQGHRFIQWKTESDLKRKITQRIKALEEARAISSTGS